MRGLRLIIFFCMLLCQSLTVLSSSSQNYNRDHIYSALRSENPDKISNEIKLLEKINDASAMAFEGTLLMKKAALVKDPAKKLKLFKYGHEKLEKAISSHPENTEFHFLRLMIQEHAPPILNYRSDVEADTKMIISNYEKLPATLQSEIFHYSKTSKSLHPKKLQHE